MKQKKQQYFIALGSNLDPEGNIIKMVEALFKLSEIVDISEIIRTEPVGLTSENYFLNTVVRIESTKNQPELKKELNAIEGDLGRDRSDPSRKYKDRTADLDILFSLAIETRFVNKTFFGQEEIYILKPLLILLKHLEYQTMVNLIDSSHTRVELHYKNKEIGLTPVQLKQVIS